MKIRISNYIFDASAKTITFLDYSTISLEAVLLITNVTKNTIIYNFADETKGGAVEGNILYLAYSTLAMEDADKLLIFYDDEQGRQIVGNARQKFRDGFASSGAQPDPTAWELNNSDHIVNAGGDAGSSSYLRLSLSPLVSDSEISILSKEKFKFPFRFGAGISISQRILGQEVGVEMVRVDSNGDVESSTVIVDKSITGATISITTNVGTVTLDNHGLKGGDRISLYGCPDSRLNVGPVIVTILTTDTFTVPITLANGSYNSDGGSIEITDPFNYAKNAASYLFENATATNASFATRRSGASARLVNVTVGTTLATQANTSPYSDAFLAPSNQELYATLDEINYRSFASDGVATMSGAGKRTQGVPDEDGEYKIRIRAKNIKGLSRPIARIVSIVKTGTTTATVTTDVPHGLTTADYVQIYGVRDITNFPNLTAQTVVGSVPTDTTFTIIIGSATSTSSAGGCVYNIRGSVLAPGAFAQNVQSISRTNNILSVIGNTTWATPLPGEFVHLYGMDGDASVYDGAYKVLRVSTSTLELESVGEDFASINCGGALIRRTDVRIHFVRVLDYTRLVAEIVGGRGNTTDINNAVPVALVGGATLATTLASTTLTPSTTVGAATHHHRLSSADTNLVNVKNAAGSISEMVLSNNGASAAFFKLYNKASAPVLASDTPIRTIMIPPNSTVVCANTAYNVRLATGISFAITGDVPIADTTVVAANQVMVNILYT
ncbi:MAG: hypothetical protein WC823_00225 [Parcubacteria group bacterium]|jgi:hypothetical protein